MNAFDWVAFLFCGLGALVFGVPCVIVAWMMHNAPLGREGPRGFECLEKQDG